MGWSAFGLHGTWHTWSYITLHTLAETRWKKFRANGTPVAAANVQYHFLLKMMDLVGELSIYGLLTLSYNILGIPYTKIVKISWFLSVILGIKGRLGLHCATGGQSGWVKQKLPETLSRVLTKFAHHPCAVGATLRILWNDPTDNFRSDMSYLIRSQRCQIHVGKEL